MDNTFTKKLFFLAIFTLFTITGVFAQTITVGTVDPGPYGQGSSIAVPINVNTTGGCINTGNTYNLYLSDASGNFTPGTLIGSYSGVYGTFVNGVIPNGTPAGVGYKVEVKSTNPAVTSTVSSAFTISGNTGVTASLATPETVSAGVFGRCVGSTSAYAFTSSAGGTVTASFFNETTQSYDASNVSIPGNFTPATTNYTVTGKSVNASGTVGTFDYQLVNNVVVNPFSPFGTPFVCMPAGGSGDLQFIMPITGPGGIINNYPGTTYTVNWGDGTSTTFTYCQIVALGGILIHTYTLPSCGQTSTGGATNSLTVVSHAVSPYCGEVASAATTSAKVIITPITSFAAPAVACVGTALTIPNTSDPGPDYSTGAASTCAVNANAKYDWTLDGVAVVGYQGVPLSKSFIFPATTTHGNHTLTLHAETPAIGCASTDYTQIICFEDPPTPVFTVPTPICITNGPVTPTNTSTVDNTCAVPQYIWTVTGPGTVTYAGGTNANSQFPQFVFPVAGTYTVQLGISSAGCGVINAAPQTITVDSAPTVTMSPDATICGNNLTFTFDPSQTTTKTVLSGTTLPTPTSYAWVITGGAYSFIGGTNATSQYPKILFADFATYTIQVTSTNACGTVTVSQTLTFVQAPTVSAGPDQPVCESNPATTLAATVTGSYTSYQWVGGTGTFAPDRNTINAVYTPSPSEITAGSVTLTFQVNTALPAPCNKVTDNMKITITPTAFITSLPTASVCSGQALSYTITANKPSATFAWTATLTSGTATGYTASGTSANITDVLTNTGTVDATVTYHIIPTIGACPGTPFDLTVAVHPLPVITAAPVLSPICNNQPANILLTSNVGGTSYTWTSAAGAGITGNTNQATPLVTTSIQDILINSGTSPASVTYTVTPYNGTCPGTPVVTSIMVEPSAIVSNAGPDQELCNAPSVTLHANDPSPQTGLWTQTSGPAGPVFSANNDPNATVTGLTPGNVYQFQWAITGSASCPPSTSTVNITIDSPPVGGTATPNPTEVCSGSGSVITLTGQSGSIVEWQSSTDGFTTWTSIVNTTATLTIPSLTQTTQYRALIHNGASCPDAFSTVATVTVDQPPTTAAAGPPDEICNTSVYTLQGNTPVNGSGKWTQVSGPAGAVFVSNTNPTTSVTGLVPGTYQFQWTITAAATCPASSSMVTIIVDDPPVGGTATATPSEVCLGSGSVITLAGQTGTILEWQSSIDGISWSSISNNTATLTIPSLIQTTQYRAKLHTSAICADVYSTVATVTVDPPPTTSIAGPPDEVCNATSYTLQGNTPAVGTGKWTQVSGPAGASFVNDINPTTTVTGLVPGTYQFQWTITATATCPASSSLVTIIIDSPPVGGTTTATPSEVCVGSNSVITLAGQLGSVVQWESSTDGFNWTVISNNTTTLTTAALMHTTQYRVKLHNTVTCPDVYSTIAMVTVDPPPTTAVAGPSDEICNTSIYTLQGNTPTVGVGKWTQIAGPAGATFTNDANPHTTVTGLLAGNTYQFQWTITSAATCPPSTSTVTIKVDDPPVGGTATPNPAEVCLGSGSVITLAGQSGTIVEWQSSTDGGVSWLSINNTTATLTIAALTQSTQYRAKLHTTAVCFDAYSTIATVIVDQPPTASIAGPPDEICNTTVYTLQGNTPTIGAGKWTQVSGPAGASFINDTYANTTVTGLIPGTYQFQWTITASATCPASSSVVAIKVDNPPVGGTATANPTEVCIGSNSAIKLAGQTGNILHWESSIDGINWVVINNATATLNTPALTQTTQYRAKVHTTTVCPDVYSTIATVTVDQPPTTAIAGPADEICNTTAYTLQGNTPLVGAGKWTQVSGPPGAAFTNASNPNTTVNGLVPGTYIFQWTITGTASCPASSSTVSIKVDSPPLGGTATPNPAEVCLGSGSQITLTGQFGTIVEWESSTDGVFWQAIPNSGNNPILQIASLTQTTQYRVKMHSSAICQDVYSTVAIVTVDQPPIAANAGQNTEICNSTSYKLQGNNPTPGTGKWTVITGSGVTFADDTDPTSIVNGLVPGQSYQFRWTITNSPVCPSTTADVTIKDDLPPIGGTTSNPATVCSGDNSGQIFLAGYSGIIKEWQSSVDGTTWQTINNAGTITTLNYSQLTQTTQFRAGVISSGICDEAFSTPTTITVNPVTPTADAGPNHDICNENVVTMQANNPAPFTGMWTQTAGPSVTIVNPNLYNTQIIGLSRGNSYTFKWTIMGIAPCPNTESSVTINSFADVIPSFTMDKNTNCGTLTVNFTNTSTPTPAGTFVWDFGDGSPLVTAINPPPHTFTPSASGASTTYTIKMTPISNCGSKTPYTAQVTISPSTPVAALVPNQSSACGAFTLVAKNLSPGDNAQYDFYLKDPSGNTVEHLSYPDKRDAVFQQIIPTAPTDYTVYVVATDKCGNQGTSPTQIISMAPSTLVSQIQIKGDVNSVCLGSPVTFQNISSGGDRFTITVYDSNKNPILTLPAGTSDMNYTPTAIGTYYVSITAGNDGCGDAPVSALKKFTVSPTPNPSFTYSADKDFNVTFDNKTPDEDGIPAASITYKWDFGDGSQFDSSYIPATHHFDVSKQPFTVTLTATTPGTNCFAVTQQTINITFHGNLFLPNAFIPASSNKDLNTFIAKGFGLKTWRMQIFNNFGQLVWQTTKLDNNGSPIEGWDGTYKGQIVEQGVYIWQITATLLNGEEWKGMSYRNSAPSKTGAIHLIR